MRARHRQVAAFLRGAAGLRIRARDRAPRRPDGQAATARATRRLAGRLPPQGRASARVDRLRGAPPAAARAAHGRAGSDAHLHRRTRTTGACWIGSRLWAARWSRTPTSEWPCSFAIRTASSSSRWRRRGFEVPDSKMLVDGKLVDAEGGATFENVNPRPRRSSAWSPTGRRPTWPRPWRRHGGHSTPPTGRPTETFRRRPATASGGDRGGARGAAPRAGRRGRLSGPHHHGPQLDAPLREALLWPAG